MIIKEKKKSDVCGQTFLPAMYIHLYFSLCQEWVMTSVVVSDGGGNIVEYVTVVEEGQQVSVTFLSMILEPVLKTSNNNSNS